MLSKEEVLHLLNEAKKEVDRLETNRQEDIQIYRHACRSAA